MLGLALYGFLSIVVAGLLRVTNLSERDVPAVVEVGTVLVIAVSAVLLVPGTERRLFATLNRRRS